MNDLLLYDKEVVCLNCEKKFKTKRVRASKIVVKKKDSDFCMHYEGEINPYYYEINVCPHCSFAFSASFKPLKPAVRENLRKNYLERAGQVDLCGKREDADALRSFKLALLCGTLADENIFNLGGICLRIAWLNRYLGQKEEEDKYLDKALECYREVYEKADITSLPLSEHKLLYLLGELSGRLGRFTETRTWFNILFSKRGIEPALNTLAREQWDEYKTAMANAL